MKRIVYCFRHGLPFAGIMMSIGFIVGFMLTPFILGFQDGISGMEKQYKPEQGKD